MAGAATHVQHLLVPKPISFQETETRIGFWANPALPTVPIEAMVAIVTAVLAILVAPFVLLLLWCLSRTHLYVSTPVGSSVEVRLEEV